MSRTLRNPAFQNVGQGKKASLVVAPGETLLGLEIDLGGTAPDVDDDLTSIVAYAQFPDGDKEILNCSGAQLKIMNVYKKHVTSDTSLMLPFTVRDAKDIISETAGAFGTLGTAGLRLEIDVLAGAPADIEIKSTRKVGAGTALDEGTLARTKFFDALSAAGTYSIMLPAGPNSPWNGLQRAYLFDSADAITNVTVRADGVEIFNKDRAANVFEQQDNGLVPNNAEMYVVDFCVNGNMTSEQIDTRQYQSIEMLVTVSGATNLTRFLEGLADIRKLR